jgi:mono/diheme cytochrome c family protein
MKSLSAAISVGAAIALAAGVFLVAPSHAAAGSPTFTETIAPIVYQNCTVCHRPGQAAPFSLISYDDVKKRATQIAAVTKSRYMPPWHAEHGYGEFADERRLTDEQIATIAQWVKQGLPEGDLAKLPAVPDFPEGWHLGKPDLILEMPAAFDLPADGPDIFRNFAVPTHLTEDKWVRAVEFHPRARKVVHHVLFFTAPGGVAGDGADGKPGFSGMARARGIALGRGNAGAGSTLAGGSLAGGSLGGWAVGATPRALPDGVAMALPNGSDLI